MDSLKFLPVGRSNWMDLERLFAARGGPHGCWCMVWRHMPTGADRANKADKKDALKNYVEQGLPVGLLGYLDGKAIAWCSIAPRPTYRPLGGDASIDNVWSLVCFFVQRPYRNQGIAAQLIAAAETYAKDNGADYVEAYPVDKSSPSYRFMGFRPTFEKAGYHYKHQAGARRHVMAKKVGGGPPQ